MPKLVRFIVAGSITALSFVTQAAVQTPAELGFSPDSTREFVHSTCKHIAIIPLSVPLFPGVDANVSARVEEAGTRALQAAGFDLISSDAYVNARQQVFAQAGGVYNPWSGAKRVDVQTKALDAGLKALMSNPQVDCIATLHAERTKANMANRYAYFNGAKEYVDGQANGTLSAMFLGASGTGTIGAVSVVMRIYDRHEKQLYGRFGGVQLTTYLDRQHGDNHGDYLNVPPSTLLQDDKRIDRAMNTITVPLRYTAEQIEAGKSDPKINTIEIDPSDFSKPPAGLHQTDKPLLVPREQILSSVHRVVIGSLMPNGLTTSPEVAARYRALVHDQLTRLGWEVIDSDQLNGAFGKAVQQVGGIYDPFTGKTDPARLKAMMQVALSSLALPAMPDGIVLISLLRTNATQVFGNVDWDGTTQSSLTLGPVIDKVVAFGGTTNVNAGEGNISAASFDLMLRDANGTLLADSRGGIQLLQKLTLQSKRESGRITYVQTYSNLLPAEILTDPARDSHAVDVAVHPLLVAPSASADTK